jgi:polyferredoxin
MFFRICTLMLTGLLIYRIILPVPSADLPLTGEANTVVFQADGYGGPIRMQMVLTNTGSIQQLQVLTHQETAAFVTQLDTFLAQFRQKTGIDDQEPGREIDVMTGATVTSRAITQAVAATLHQQPARKDPLPLLPLLLSATLGLSALAALLLGNRILRGLVLLSALFLFGLAHRSIFSILQIAGIQTGHAPALFAAPWWWISFVLALVPALILGRLYCSSLCPFAAIQELLAKIQRIPRKQFTPAAETDRRARKIKYLVLLALLTLTLVLGHLSVADIEPYITFFTGRGTWPVWSLLILVLAAGTFFFRFWCRYLCPAGAFIGLVARFARWKIQSTPACTGCHVCLAACPVNALEAEGSFVQAETAECILCGHCLKICPQKCLHLTATQARPASGTQKQRRAVPSPVVPEQTWLLPVFLLLSVLLLTLGVMYNIYQSTSTAATAESATPDKSEHLKKELLDMGLTLHPAKYWKP